MEGVVFFLLCGVALINGQIVNPLTTALGMGGVTTGWGNGMLHSGMRYPGMMQQSHLSSMTYPTWRAHPIYRVAAVADQPQKGGSNPLSDLFNVQRVPSAQEVLTHMALATQNIKPYVDTIADFLYEPQKARTVVTPMASVAPVAPVSTMGTVSPVAPVASVASMSPVQPVYVPGMGVMRATGNLRDDCGPEEAVRLERAMDFFY